MREILFRGKRVDNGEWVYGDLAHKSTNEKNYLLIHYTKNNDYRYFEVISESVGQFTGLTDKNGTKIFEGDLIEFDNNSNWILEVEFKNEYVGGWVLTHESNTNHISLGARNKYDIEVVDCIY